ncbi:hypothetical protein ACIQ9E_26950 [Streptomyces sp. NPDC094448]|uniref:hypothetical protein n=1 Tax=Streptomyces sp. NPDC094448 TaxID=3366063 RepID=UPI0037F2404E
MRPGIRAGAGVLLAVALLTGCTGSGGGGDGDFRVAAQPSPEAAGAPSALAIGDVKVAGYTVGEPASAERIAPADVRPEPRKCAALAYAVAGTAAGKPRATESRRAAGKGITTLLTVASYDGDGGAVAALEEVSAAAEACAAGFTFTVKGTTREVAAVTRALAPPGTDQAMAFTAMAGTAGATAPVQVVVVRKGSRVGWFTAAPTTGTKPGKGTVEVPEEVVNAQLAKLLG